MTAALLSALISLGIEGVREIGPSIIVLLKAWILSIRDSLTSREGSQESESMYAAALRVVRNMESTDLNGNQKEDAARRIMVEWNAINGDRFRKRHLYHAIASAVLALEIPDIELAALNEELK